MPYIFKQNKLAYLCKQKYIGSLVYFCKQKYNWSTTVNKN